MLLRTSFGCFLRARQWNTCDVNCFTAVVLARFDIQCRAQIQSVLAVP